MIEFAAIMVPVTVSVLQAEPHGELEDAPSTLDGTSMASTENGAPPFVLEPVAPDTPKTARSRRRHIGPPASVRDVAREEVQLTLGF